MGDIAIRVDGLGKQYRLGRRERYKTLRESIMQRLAIPYRRLQSVFQHSNGKAPNGDGIFWALKDVSFEVKHGEMLGVIGRNGAGKSTLLKILSRITEPTEGYADICGRVGSLLEVGTGFHPELTGRENIYLNGAILGMTRREIARKFDEIVAFAEIEKFLDTAVKHYSSGMYMRLAFAVAAHLDPEILVIDEVLAVGDAQFQNKCLGKMGEVAKEGRTLLFVSHNMAAVQSLCHRVLWLRTGSVADDGPALKIVRQYLALSLDSTLERVWADGTTAPQNEYICLRAVRVQPARELTLRPLTVHDPLDLVFEYDVLREGIRLNLSVQVYSRDEVCAFNVSSYMEATWDGKLFPSGRFRSVCRVPGDLLNDGRHRVSLMFIRDTSVCLFQVQNALEFEIGDSPADRGNWYGDWPGAVRPRLQWTTERILGPATETIEARSGIFRDSDPLIVEAAKQ
jgi:lipopolysaccharide transport system ATP-binding protein